MRPVRSGGKNKNEIHLKRSEGVPKFNERMPAFRTGVRDFFQQNLLPDSSISSRLQHVNSALGSSGGGAQLPARGPNSHLQKGADPAHPRVVQEPEHRLVLLRPAQGRCSQLLRLQAQAEERHRALTRAHCHYRRVWTVCVCCRRPWWNRRSPTRAPQRSWEPNQGLSLRNTKRPLDGSFSRTYEREGAGCDAGEGGWPISRSQTSTANSTTARTGSRDPS